VFVREFKQDKERQKIAKRRSDMSWFLNDSSVDLRKNPYNRLLEKGGISLVKNKDKIDFLSRLVGESVLDNIRIYKWKYKEEDFLQENVSIEDLIKNPNKYRSVKNMFLISGWKLKDFSKKLKGQTTTVYSNLLDEVKRNIDNLIRRNWSSHKNLKIELEHRGKTLSIHLHEPGSKTPPEFRSDGLKWFLTFLINFRAQSKNISNYILLIDEPGLYLHPRGQKDVLEELENLSRNNQIIYTTHQTFLINKNKPERVHIIKRVPEKKGRFSIHPFYASKATEALNSKSILTDKLLREALGFKVSDISPINEKNILTEGVFDREVFHLVNDYWRVIDLNETSIISCGRASEIAKHASLYKGNELKVVCFYDSDGPGRLSYNSNDKVLSLEKKQVRDFIKKSVYETMEDLIPDKVYKTAIEEWVKQWKIKFSVSVIAKRPRMKNIKKHFIKGKDIEMKHELERILIDKIKSELNNDGAEFKIFKTILSEFKIVL